MLASYFYENSNFEQFERKFWADVSLKPDFTFFAEKIIISLGGKVSKSGDITELINDLLDCLSQGRYLLLVDNLETLINSERNWTDKYYQEFFSRWLQHGKNSILLLTTQDKPQLFQGLQHWHPLGGMKLEEGITLLNKLDTQGTELEFREFVQYVDGHPLTINLVAGYLREYCDGQLNQVTKLGLEKFDLAYKKAKGNHRDKQNARLSWIIKQHLKRLTKEQQNFLFNLSVYRLPFNCEAASYLWIDEAVKIIVVQKALQELRNRSLLVKTVNNKYQIQSVVKEYIYQQDIDLTTAHQQAIGYYSQHLKKRESWQVLEDVREHLEVIYHRCELKEYALTNKSIYYCCDFLTLRGYYSILVELYEQLISKWQPNLQSKDRNRISNSFNNLGNAYYYLGDYQRAIDCLQKSLKIATEIGDRHYLSNSLNNLGNAYDSLGDYQRAINYLQKSLNIKREIGDRHGINACLNNLGSAYNSLGDYQRAIDYHQQSLEIKREIGDHNDISNSLNNLGNVCFSLGDYQRAINYYQQSLEIKRDIGHRNGISDCLNNLGSSYNSLGEYQKAIDYHQQSLEINKEIGDRDGISNSLGSLGNAYDSLGEYQKAIDYHQQSLEIKTEIGDRDGISSCLNNLGSIYNSLGDYQKAIDYHQQSLEIKTEIGDRDGIGCSLNNLGNVYHSLAEYQRAVNYYQQSLEIKEEIGDRHGVSSSLTGLGNAYRFLGEYQRAINYYEQSLEIKEEIGDRNVGNSLLGLGNAYYSLGEYKTAINYYQQSSEIAREIGDRNGEAIIWFNLGIICENLQQKTKAKIAYEKARKLYQAMRLDKKVEDCDKAIQSLEEE
jgi:tetratricopeptide (TPR) repeat protein